MQPMLGDLLSQIAKNVLTTLIDEEIDSPYLKAALGPVADAFSQGIMQGLTPEAVGQKAVEVSSGMPALANVSAQDWQKTYEQYALAASSNVSQAGLSES
jgi:hypothetical protein